MLLDTWETNSAFEIGTLALRPSHHVSAIAHITNRSMTPTPGLHIPFLPNAQWQKVFKWTIRPACRSTSQRDDASSRCWRVAVMHLLLTETPVHGYALKASYSLI